MVMNVNNDLVRRQVTCIIPTSALISKRDTEAILAMDSLPTAISPTRNPCIKEASATISIAMTAPTRMVRQPPLQTRHEMIISPEAEVTRAIKFARITSSHATTRWPVRTTPHTTGSTADSVTPSNRRHKGSSIKTALLAVFVNQPKFPIELKSTISHLAMIALVAQIVRLRRRICPPMVRVRKGPQRQR